MRNVPLTLPSVALLSLALMGAPLIDACSGEGPQPVPVEMPAEPASAEPAPLPTIVTEDGRPVDPDTARAIGQALRDLQNGESEPVPAADTVAGTGAARDASALHGRWSVRHTIYRTNGEGGPPSPPLAPTTWEFTPAGAFLVRGGSSIDARYMYTGDRIVVSGFGPVQDYRLDRLDDGELRVTSVIEAGSLRIENTTVLDRAR